MITVMKKIEIDMGHRVPYHNSKCKNIHGHRYVIEVELNSDALIPTILGESESEMVMDFGKIKEALMESIHDVYDHALVLWDRDPMYQRLLATLLPEFEPMKIIGIPVIPTAEGLAEFWGREFWECLVRKMETKHQQIGLCMKKFTVWETPNSYATYG